MRKVVLFLIFILFAVIPAYALYQKTDSNAYTSAFYVRINFCIPMKEIQPLADGGKVIRQILGFKGTNHICHYAVEQYDAAGKLTQKTTCNLTQRQRLNYKQAMKSDLKNEGAAKKMFEQFSKDENVCKVENFNNDKN